MPASDLLPLISVRIVDEVEKPAQESETIIALQTELAGVRTEYIDERTRIVVAATDGVRDDARDRFRVFVLVEQIGGNARRACDRHPREHDVFA